jgi:hypothetical protein
MIGVGDLVKRTGDDRTSQILDGQTIERSGGAVCGLHLACGDEERDFLDLALKPWSTVCEWFDLKTTQTVFFGLASKLVVMVFSAFASKSVSTVSAGLASKPDATVSGGLTSKPTATVSAGLTSKPVATVSWFGPQNQSLRFGDLGLKITVMVSSFGPENQADFGLLVTPQNRWKKVGAGHASRSSGLLHVKASRTTVSQCALKIGRGAMAGGACDTITEVTSESF